MSSPIFAFFSSPITPPQTPVSVSKPTTTTTSSDSYWESNVTLFTHQDGKKFQVSIIRLDENVDVDSDDMGGHREEDWDSDDWDEDAEDLEEPVPQPYYPQQSSHVRLHPALVAEDASRTPEQSGADRLDHTTVDDWDGDAQDLEETEEEQQQQVANGRPDRPDWARRQRDADVWRTRLGED